MIVTVDQLPPLRAKHANQRIVLVSGVFDLLHRGHVQYLQNARRHGDVVVALVKSDARVRQGKGPSRPVLPESDRASMVDAIKGVDYVVVGPHTGFANAAIDPMYETVFTALRPDVFYSTNGSWQKLQELGIGRIIIEDRLADAPLRSTTAIIEHIKRRTAS